MRGFFGGKRATVQAFTVEGSTRLSQDLRNTNP
jgi:hypothetical protein